MKRLSETKAVKAAKDKVTPKSQLLKIAGLYPTSDRILARRSDLSNALLRKLARSQDTITRKYLASNPCCDFELVVGLAEEFPAQAAKVIGSHFKNQSEARKAFSRVDDDLLIVLLRQRKCSDALVNFALSLGGKKRISQAKAAVFLVAGMLRLEERFPELREVGNSISAIRPTFEAKLRIVPNEALDRRKSLIGPLPFLTKAVPAPQDHVPIIQLNLDELSLVTGENVGHGLLQLWMPDNYWGSGEGLDNFGLREISTATYTKDNKLVGLPEFKNAKLAMQKRDKKIQRIRRKKMAGQSILWEEAGISVDYEAELAAIGLHWSEYFVRPGQAIQITGWKKSGYAIPKYQFWDEDALPSGLPKGLKKDPIFSRMQQVASEKSTGYEKCALFGLHKASFDCEPCMHDSDGWRPLVVLEGPMGIGIVVDEHTIFFRKNGRRFEYACGLNRYN